MRPALPMLLLLAAAAPVARAADPAAEAAALFDQVVAWRRDIHQHPELGNRETRTAAKVAAHLRELGLEVRTGVGKTGVVGILAGARPGPFLALRADMDALPVTEATGLPFASTATDTWRGETVGVMHACGHDAHVAVLMGAAQALAARRASLPGKVMFVFQPAEEGLPEGEEGGADLMLAEGLFEPQAPDAIVGLHVSSNLNTGQIGLRAGAFMAASDTFSIRIDGRQTHGSRPWQGVDPIVAASHVVLALQSIVSREVDLTGTPAVVTIGQIRGGVRQNIIPERVDLLGTIRTFEADVREQVFAAVERRATRTAEANGASARFHVHAGGYPVTVNDPALTARMLPALRAAVGDDAVIEMSPVTGAEDFSFYAQRVPGLYFFVGVTAPGLDPASVPSNHSPEFLVDEDGLEVALRAMLAAADAFLGAGDAAAGQP